MIEGHSVMCAHQLANPVAYVTLIHGGVHRLASRQYGNEGFKGVYSAVIFKGCKGGFIDVMLEGFNGDLSAVMFEGFQGRPSIGPYRCSSSSLGYHIPGKNSLIVA